jgi:hypothetical protein
MNRRNFLKLALGAAAMVAAPKIAFSGERIWMDGAHCDAKGISALLRGDVVEFMTDVAKSSIGWDGRVLKVSGDFTLFEPIQIDTLSDVTVNGGMYHLNEGADVPFYIDNCKSITIQNVIVRHEMSLFDPIYVRPGDYPPFDLDDVTLDEPAFINPHRNRPFNGHPNSYRKGK